MHPEDRGVWERLEGAERKPLETWAAEISTNVWTLPASEALLHLPGRSILYALDSLTSGELTDAQFDEMVADLHACTLHALCRVTRSDEWIYAVADPDATWLYSFRFWPHRASTRSNWYVSPVPDGDDQFFASQGFEQGILGLWDLPQWHVCVFGERLIEAFAEELPQAFSRVH